ncbi:MAG: ATP-binding protein [Bacteroidales bacterium]|nr:ATP-binding protein [Bacteroidales bacterium]
MKYYTRIAENEINQKLLASGALLIKGPKSCGKTETAKQFAKSILEVDRNEQVPIVMSIDPKILLQGKTPRLIDEWQEQPKLWNYVRHEVDDRKKKAQFILTGSANSEEEIKLHSGAGRFTIVEMQTMSWQEMGYSSGLVSLNALLNGEAIAYSDNSLSLELVVERMIKGGWPALLNSPLNEAILLNRAYIDLLAETDMSRVSNVKRDPQKVRSLLRSIARNIATLVDNTTLEKDIKALENTDLSRPTIIDYLNALSQLMIFEEQAAFNTHIRSSSSLRKSPKRHFCDVSLAIAALKLDKKRLMNDLKYCGFLFESLVYHDLKMYALANDAEIFHYRDAAGLEVDAIIQQTGGKWAAFEVKLGIGMLDEAAKNLLKFNVLIDEKKHGKPASLNIITGTGLSFTRPDGINVISLASLGK